MELMIASFLGGACIGAVFGAIVLFLVFVYLAQPR
jgi:hypothetical protein